MKSVESSSPESDKSSPKPGALRDIPPVPSDDDISLFRRSTTFSDCPTVDETNEQRVNRIVNNRGCWKGMPVLCSTDLVHGSWWFVWGSVISFLIPLFPLISLYLGSEQWWPPGETGMERDIHMSAYALMIFLGVCYTAGSYAFLRAVEYPVPPPLLKDWYHFQSDELLGMWLFFFGTVSTVPICAMYTAYSEIESEQKLYLLATCICAFFSLLFFIATLACYPGLIIAEEFEHRHDPKQYLSPWITPCFPEECCGYRLKYHLGNDWLIVSWGMTWGCVVSIVLSMGLLVNAIVIKDARSIYDYATSILDLIFFFFGSLYFALGSYANIAEEHKKIVGALNDPQDTTMRNPMAPPKKAAAVLEV